MERRNSCMTAKDHSLNQNYSETFYADHAERYAEVAHEYRQSIYLESSHPLLKGDLDLQTRVKQLIPPPARGLDAGCGAGARDVYALWQAGYEMWGIDAVAENVRVAHHWHPEIQDRVTVHDLRDRLPFADHAFDIVMCNAVIQHIDPDRVYDTVLPELVRVLRPGGILQLMFKSGNGVATLYDKDYGAYRSFQLFDGEQILKRLQDQGMNLIAAEQDALGGVMWFVDPKHSRHCAMLLRKGAHSKLLQ
ncbi:methyltransferase domain-containing protein [candidate division KSB3 bacterium]|uniref:Methyltransferase domain-containing protein n=1 Tax=candidate division KSB3 bacterium TaxID=2044937 RepID=A0A9D5JWY0_9BACT|nr:methyltransferase domain-containing protein [candidate division KSB3 bacterium]MBD3325241.1 methyltransferase domain-containing protein [candidate division KSB3 bacterium]